MTEDFKIETQQKIELKHPIKVAGYLIGTLEEHPDTAEEWRQIEDMARKTAEQLEEQEEA